MLVLGGGTAGCVLAGRLSEDPGRRVGLVEAGPDYGPYDTGRWPEDMLDARALALESHCWETDREDRSQLRARILGGCSAHNACVVLRGADSDYDEWGHGWSAEQLAPYLDRAERELRTRPTEREALSPWHRAFADAAGSDAILHAVNAVGTVRWNAAFAYVDPARERPNLTILADTLVDRVRVEDGGVVAITDRGELTAGTAVLAAGAYGSPGILLRSGIGPAEELRRHGIPVVADLPVGEGLVDHVGTGLGFEPTGRARVDVAEFERGRPAFMAQVTVSLRSHVCPEGICDLFFFPALDPDCEISAAVFAMKPRSRGAVRLNGREPDRPLAIDHGFLSKAADTDVLTEGVERLRELVAASPVADYAARESRPGPDVDAPTHVRATARGFFHPVATCALGRVADGDGRLLGVEDFVVADASFIPTIPGANTNLTVAAVAERIAERL